MNVRDSTEPRGMPIIIRELPRSTPDFTERTNLIRESVDVRVQQNAEANRPIRPSNSAPATYDARTVKPETPYDPAEPRMTLSNRPVLDPSPYGRIIDITAY